jgi:hypothetical protein
VIAKPGGLETRTCPILRLYRRQPCSLSGAISEIGIWRTAQLMLKRCGEKALEESAVRADELALAGDDDGAATWRLITAAVTELANTTPRAPMH